MLRSEKCIDRNARGNARGRFNFDFALVLLNFIPMTAFVILEK